MHPVAILVIIILIFIAAWLILSILKRLKKEKKLPKIAQNLIGGFHIKTKVENLTQKEFMKLDLSKFWVLDKFDGERKEYEDDNYHFLYEEVEPLNAANKINYVFEVLKSDGVDVTSLNFEKRLQSKLPEGFFPKPISKITEKDELLARLNNNSSDTVFIDDLEIPIDGLILQNDYQSFKIKKSYLNTIDFRFIYENGKLYLETLNKDGKSFDRFFNPFFDNNVCYLNEEPELSTVSPRIRKVLEDGFKFIVTNAQSLSERFGEFSNVNGKWYFMRLRDHPNSSINAIKITALIYNPLHTKEGYFNNLEPDPVQQMFHKMSHAVRSKLFDIIKEECGECKRVLNIAGGRGGDLKEMRRIGVISSINIDSDRDAVVNYALKAPFTSIVSNNVITKTSLSKIKDLLKKRKSFVQSDVILINFAIHYILDCIPVLKTFIEELSIQNSKLFVTFFDADLIIEDLNKKGKKGGKVIRKLKRNLDFGDSVQTSNVSNPYLDIGPLKIEMVDGQLKMPMPTISTDSYSIEPMVSRNHLKGFGSKIKFKSLEVKDQSFEQIQEYTKYIYVAIVDINLDNQHSKSSN